MCVSTLCNLMKRKKNPRDRNNCIGGGGDPLGEWCVRPYTNSRYPDSSRRNFDFFFFFIQTRADTYALTRYNIIQVYVYTFYAERTKRKTRGASIKARITPKRLFIVRRRESHGILWTVVSDGGDCSARVRFLAPPHRRFISRA